MKQPRMVPVTLDLSGPVELATSIWDGVARPVVTHALSRCANVSSAHLAILYWALIARCAQDGVASAGLELMLAAIDEARAYLVEESSKGAHRAH